MLSAVVAFATMAARIRQEDGSRETFEAVFQVDP